MTANPDQILNFREWLGLVVLVLSVALVPVGMYVSPLLWAASFVGGLCWCLAPIHRKSVAP